MKLYKNIKSEQGAALIMTLILFTIIVVLATSVFVLAQNNTRQVVVQEEGMESYYIARSGAEVSFQALSEDITLLNYHETNNTPKNFKIEFDDEGEADVTIIGFDEDSKRRVRIVSIGTAIGKSHTSQTILEFDFEGLGNITWTR